MQIGGPSFSSNIAAIQQTSASANNNKVTREDKEQPVREVSELGKQLSSTGTIEGVGDSLNIDPAAEVGSNVNILV